MIERQRLGAILDSGTAFDADAQAYFTATGLDASLQDAYNTFVLNLKTGIVNGTNVWDEFIQLLILVSGDNSINAVNLMNPGTFDGLIINSPSAALTGVTLDGLTQYINNQVNALNDLTHDDVTFTFAIRNNPPQGNSTYAIGAYDGATKRIDMQPRNTSDQAVFRAYASPSQAVVSNTTGGLFTGVRRSVTNSQAYKAATGGTIYTTEDAHTHPDGDIYTGCLNRIDLAAPGNFLATNEWTLTGCLTALSSDQVSDYNAAYNQFLTDLGI